MSYVLSCFLSYRCFKMICQMFFPPNADNYTIFQTTDTAAERLHRVIACLFACNIYPNFAKCVMKNPQNE